jgi:hypothetical protein
MLLYDFLKGLKGSKYLKTRDAMSIPFTPEHFSEEWKADQKKVLKETYPDLSEDDSLHEINFQGLTISIENPEGSTREGTKPDGSPWQTKFFHPYGFIKHTLGVDGDEVDCFIGPNPTSQNVYIIHQRINGKYDEDKVMLGFDDEEHARDAYLAHYDTQQRLGPITFMPFSQFKEVLEEKGKAGIKLKED